MPKQQQPKGGGNGKGTAVSRALKTRKTPRRRPADEQAAAMGVLGRYAGTASNPMLASIAGSSSEPFRLPDSILEESVPLVLTNEYTITSDAAGYAAWGENSNLSYAKLGWTVTAGAVGTVATTAHPDTTTYAAAFAQSRMLMYRITVEYIGSELNAAGRLYALNAITTSGFDSQTLANVYDDANYTGKAVDGFYDTVLFNQSPRYETTSSSTYMIATFPIRIMFAAGLPPNTVCYRVRVDRFMEGLPGRESLHRGSASVELYDAPMMEVLTNVSHPGLHGGAAAQKSDIVAQVWKGIKAGAGAAWHHRLELGALAGKYASGNAAKTALLALTAA